MEHRIRRSGSRVLALAAAVVTAGVCTPAVVEAGESWAPNRPVRLIISNLPGSAPDVIGRFISAGLTEVWGQQVVADNRAGATGLIAAETVARAAPDGYTLWLTTMTQLIATLQAQKNLLARDFVPVSLAASTPFVIVVPASLPVKTLSEWFAYARARPGKLSYGSNGTWGSSHLCMEAINKQVGIDVAHISYKGSTLAMNDLVAGRIEAYCPAAPNLGPAMQTGRVRALAMTYLKPTRLAPGLPPVAETVPGFELLGWYGVQMPPKTPKHIVAAVHAALVRVLKQPDVMDKLVAVGAESVASTPEHFAAFLQRETARWDKVLKEGGGAVPPSGGG